jgi:hypothetical protein
MTARLKKQPRDLAGFSEVTGDRSYGRDLWSLYAKHRRVEWFI